MAQDLMHDSLLEGSPLECSICLDRMSDISYLLTQPDTDGNVCTHYFCSGCINPLVLQAKSNKLEPRCPSCRRVVMSVQKSKLANNLLIELEGEREERKRTCQARDAAVKLMKESELQMKSLEKDLSIRLTKEIRARLEEEAAVRLEEEIATRLENEVASRVEEEVAARLEEEFAVRLKKELDEQLRQHQEESSHRIKGLTQQLEDLKMQLMKESQARREISLQALEKDKALMKKEVVLAECQRKVHEAEEKNSEYRYKNEELQKALQKERNNFILAGNRGDELINALSKLEKEVESKEKERAKWHKMFIQARDMTYKTPPVEPVKPAKPEENSWFSPLSYVPTFWTAKIGPLVRDSKDFRFLEKRGPTRQSKVWRACTVKGSHDIAFKQINPAEPKNMGFREAMILHKLDHKNLMKVDGVLRDVPIPNGTGVANFMMLPFVGFDLDYVISDQVTYKLKPHLIRRIMYQLLSGLYYMHSGEIVHRDIHPTAILLDSAGNVKIACFGQARSLYSQPFSKLNFSRYASPENQYMAAERPASAWKASDIWSAGLVFAQMLRLTPLFHGKDRNALLAQIFSFNECRPNASYISRFPVLNAVPLGKLTSLVEQFSTVKDTDLLVEAYGLIKQMLVFDPDYRITAAEALQTKYFTESNLPDTPRTCPLANELLDTLVPSFVSELCGGP